MSEDMSLQIQLQAENQTAAGFTEVDDALRGIKDFLKSVADAAREATNVVRDMGKTASDAAKSAGDGMKGFQDKTKSLRETIALTEEELRKMTDVSAIRTASGEVVKAEEMAINDLKKLYQEANDVNVMITKSMNHASGNSAGPSGHGGGGMFSNEGSMNLMYAGMTMGAAALPVDAAIKSSVGAFGQFSQAMANVNSMAQMSSSQLQKMSQQVMDLSKTVPVGPVNLANALYGIVGAGVPAADAMQFLKTAAQSSVAGQVDLTTATNALVYVMGSYGLKAKDIGQVSDQMFAANAAGAMTFQQFASSLGTVAGAAAATGVPFQQVAAATAALTNEGISSQRATMGLRALLMGIAAPTKVATKEAQSLGISWDENTLKSKGLVGMLQEAMSATHGNAQELKKLIPNIAAWTVAVDLGGKGAGQFTNAMNQMNSSSGATSRAMQAQLQGYQEKMSEMKSAVQGSQIAFVNGFAPAIEQAANVVKDLAQAFQNLSPHTQKLIGDIAIAAGAFLTVSAPLFMFLSGIGQLKMGLQAIGLLKTAEDAKKVAEATTDAKIATQGLAVAEAEAGGASEGGLFASLLGGGKGMLSGLKSIGTAMRAALFAPFTAMRALPGMLTSMGKSALGAIKSIPKGISLLFDGMTKSFTGMLTFFTKGIPQLVMNFMKLMSVENILKGLKLAFTVLTGPWGILIAAIVAGVALIISHWKQITDWVKKNFGTSIPQIMQHLKDDMTSVWNGIKAATQAVWDFLKPYIMSAIQAIEKFWKQVWPELKQLFQEVWTAMKIILAPIIAWMGAIVIATLGFIKGAWQNGWDAIKAALKLVWDTMVGIIKIAWDLISGVIKVALDLLTGHWGKAWNDMKDMVGNIWNDIKQTFGNMVKDAEDFGKNLIEAIAKGIEGAVQSVVQAAENVVSRIRSALGLGGGGASSSLAVSTSQMAVAATGSAGSNTTINHITIQGHILNQDTLTNIVNEGQYNKMKLTQKFGY